MNPGELSIARELFTQWQRARGGRLTLQQLRCEVVAEPLAWRRGPASVAWDAPVLVVESRESTGTICRKPPPGAGTYRLGASAIDRFVRGCVLR